MRHHYLVSYDIGDPTRLRKVHKTVRDFGEPLQLSVFACMLSTLDRSTLEARLLDIIDSTADQILLVRLAPVHASDTALPGCRTLGRPLNDGLVRSILA